MGVGQLSESDAVDALMLPFYSSSHPTGSHGWRNQFDLGNPEVDVQEALVPRIQLQVVLRCFLQPEEEELLFIRAKAPLYHCVLIGSTLVDVEVL